MCHHGVPCVVQLYDGYGDGSRRFFQYPYGLWVDPPLPEPTQEYIHYLKCKIFDPERKVEDLQSEFAMNPWAIDIAGTLICTDPWCKCPYHHNKDRPLSPPSSRGAGYNGAGPSKPSQSQFY
ncbi:hypothetical protein SETIT_4G260700v2 [Setaria italica]|uniref:Uncharacterized protein n=1 Tax=Setaria italica TaxID=4555 RepID=A0A368QYD4_SETIT|nr:hypothetical protein SETIT_4G260700v2 [Setaria italica]